MCLVSVGRRPVMRFMGTLVPIATYTAMYDRRWMVAHVIDFSDWKQTHNIR